MLSLANYTLLPIPLFTFSTIKDKISKTMENQLKSTLEIIKKDEENFYKFAYEKNETLTPGQMQEVEKLEDFYLWYSDTLADIVESEENKKEKLYKYFDELYTLVLKLTTEISYIRSKNRQLLENAA